MRQNPSFFALCWVGGSSASGLEQWKAVCFWVDASVFRSDTGTAMSRGKHLEPLYSAEAR
jgi:hypothetical protein